MDPVNRSAQAIGPSHQDAAPGSDCQCCADDEGSWLIDATSSCRLHHPPESRLLLTAQFHFGMQHHCRRGMPISTNGRPWAVDGCFSQPPPIARRVRQQARAWEHRRNRAGPGTRLDLPMLSGPAVGERSPDPLEAAMDSDQQAVSGRSIRSGHSPCRSFVLRCVRID